MSSHRRPGLGVLAARLLFAVQDELYERLELAGHGRVTRLHGAVFAHLDEDGTRTSEIARRSGRHKQVIGRIVDDLEALGYVARRSEETDRRAKLVIPTDRGLEVLRLSDEAIGEIEARLADALGEDVYQVFDHTFRAVLDELAD
ncbi:MarR family transcriptional regulator [Herbihabitans rhizosphaerae]|uniref:MarR family transcriptional regulator n=1 Tax=Herbihabitans rhizosphaerae TaxID=1872711 RepID=A0A4Q7KGM0_9PSEU|nr:MarR family transcriptional regulator [Herbihabitans rhizosphaerae]RZS33998.1 MarR family transcriptional regulator [Herbihabitans rhizosphaerae]